ncbi:DUF2059 domain-containing protein [Zunongwangia atlantica]|uniref:DUF2059 domain-containing protein n=1 Tax=Zunongwangia atlantica 22II14-10F7 TaxID=1185767 RepID=A0A1Y1T770_9FLAO|nr:DUF2059 domain-containing protein [Zunongwangia atlantica]ORL46906.1 hypothetical protein IIF7_02771 [Zunongwangia atlantica 22II14-10F7]
MKKLVFILFVILGTSVFAQETEGDAFQKKAIKLIELTSGQQFEVISEPIVNQIPEGNREAFKKELKASLNGLYVKLAEIYREQFTEAELDEILAFYDTPVGKKMVATTPKVMEKAMTVGQQWGMELQSLVAKYMQ